jgi:hypothetical protein
LYYFDELKIVSYISAKKQRLRKQHPNRRVCLITFSDDVSIVGDGTVAPVVVAGDRLHNYDDLFLAGKR